MTRSIPEATAELSVLSPVTLVVYEWHSVQPGTLSWVFPSLHAAIEAVRALKNAVKWVILAGRRTRPPADVDAARAQGRVLLEAV